MWMTLLDIALVLASLLVLWKAADWLVESSSRIARAIGLSDLVIGLTLVGFGTSAPEFLVSADAALRGKPDISVANVVGSNIFNLCLVMGLCSMIVPLAVSRMVLRKDVPIMLVATSYVLVFVLDSEIARWEAGVLGLLLAGYLYLRFRYDRSQVRSEDASPFRKRDVALSLASLACLYGASRVMVDSSSNLARAAGISEWMIGLTIVAGGTSLPELAASLGAAFRQKHDISVGNLVGSNIFNIFGVLGLAGVLHPLHVDPSAGPALYAFLPVTLVAVLFMFTGRRVVRWEGAVLVAAALVVWGLGMIKPEGP